MATSELFVPRDLLDECRGWQEAIATAPNLQAQAALAQDVCAQMSGRMKFRGSAHVIVHTEVALMLNTGLSAEEEIWPLMQFGELTLQGFLGKMHYIRLRQEGALALLLSDVRVLDTPAVVTLDTTSGADLATGEELESAYYLPVERMMQRPLFVPVPQIVSMLSAA